MQKIKQYFPDLNEQQLAQLSELGSLYKEWNQKINVISRKDIDNVYDHHILHSMALAKFIQFKPESKVLDLGTGGGLPGIPMAILFPETSFTLIDGTGKKIMVVREIANNLGLKNVKPLHVRAEELKEKFEFVICRAVASLDKLVMWSERLVNIKKQQHVWPNGLITLKGGNIEEEINALPKGFFADEIPLSGFYEEAYYDEKYIIYVQM